MARILVIPVFIPHQGCSHCCIFCNQNLITAGAAVSSGRIPDSADIDRIVSEYLPYQGDRDRVELAFFGGNFLGLPQNEILTVLRAVEPWLDKGIIHGIRCSTRPDTITVQILKQIKPYGLDLVELGVQSMDDRVLSLSRRGHTRQDTLDAAERLKAAGMGLGVQLMTGLPGDSARTCEQTARTAADLAPDLARIYPVLVLAGSPLAGQYERGGYRPQKLDDAVAQAAGMVRILEGKGTPVVRLGLQAAEGLEDKASVLAGPWHPAFGHLVRSALMLEQVLETVSFLSKGQADVPPCRQVVLSVHPRWESRLRGDKNGNLQRLGQEFPHLAFQIVTDPDLVSESVEVTCFP